MRLLKTQLDAQFMTYLINVFFEKKHINCYTWEMYAILNIIKNNPDAVFLNFFNFIYSIRKINV